MKNNLKSKIQLAVFLTDFGAKDAYAGVMKGVILRGAPNASLIDLTHGIPAHDIRLAAYQLMTSYRYFPKGTLFVCVVDPGVGSGRKILYAEAGSWKFLAPDNGLLSWVFREIPPKLVIDVSSTYSNDPLVSRTFHGRDIFSPAAAKILRGIKPRSLGPVLKSWEPLRYPEVRKLGALWEGEVLAVDGFGNIITNISVEELETVRNSSKLWFEWGKPKTIVRHLADSYSSVAKGKLLAIPGSGGFVEIICREGNAADQTHTRAEDVIRLHIRL